MANIQIDFLIRKHFFLSFPSNSSNHFKKKCRSWDNVKYNKVFPIILSILDFFQRFRKKDSSVHQHGSCHSMNPMSFKNRALFEVEVGSCVLETRWYDVKSIKGNTRNHNMYKLWVFPAWCYVNTIFSYNNFTKEFFNIKSSVKF